MIAFFPTVKNNAGDKKRRCSQVKDSFIQAFGRFFTKLLCGFGADRALRK